MPIVGAHDPFEPETLAEMTSASGLYGINSREAFHDQFRGDAGVADLNSVSNGGGHLVR